MSKIIAKFQVTSAFSMSFAKGCGALLEATHKGQNGLLYVVHCGRLEDKMAEKADWIISCYLPNKWIHKSPFGLVNTVATVKLYKENTTDLLFYIEEHPSQRWEMLTQVPDEDIEESYYAFAGEIGDVFITLRERGMDIFSAIFGIANNLPERWRIYKGYIVHSLHFYGYLDGYLPEDWWEVTQIQL
jgi:hypothetical protein